jgi:hypothetical protein
MTQSTTKWGIILISFSSFVQDLDANPLKFCYIVTIPKAPAYIERGFK